MPDDQKICQKLIRPTPAILLIKTRNLSVDKLSKTRCSIGFKNIRYKNNGKAVPKKVINAVRVSLKSCR